MGVSDIWGGIYSPIGVVQHMGTPTSPHHMQIPLENKDAQGSIRDIWVFFLNIWGCQEVYKCTGDVWMYRGV